MDDQKQVQDEDAILSEEIQKDKTSSDEVEKELEAVKNLSQQLENNYKRALADYQNLQRRTQEEKVGWIRMANREFILKLLPVFDTLVLAEKHTKDQNFTLLVQQFLQVLKDEGIEPIKTVNEIFDPLTMEVVETREGEDGKVLEEVKTGFSLGDIILRPSFVVVGKKKEK